MVGHEERVVVGEGGVLAPDDKGDGAVFEVGERMEGVRAEDVAASWSEDVGPRQFEAEFAVFFGHECVFG